MGETPTPRGYKKMPIPVGQQGFIIVLSCQKCGGLVLMHRTHDDWHKKNDKK